MLRILPTFSICFIRLLLMMHQMHIMGTVAQPMTKKAMFYPTAATMDKHNRTSANLHLLKFMSFSVLVRLHVLSAHLLYTVGRCCFPPVTVSNLHTHTRQKKSTPKNMLFSITLYIVCGSCVYIKKTMHSEFFPSKRSSLSQ